MRETVSTSPTGTPGSVTEPIEVHSAGVTSVEGGDQNRVAVVPPAAVEPWLRTRT